MSTTIRFTSRDLELFPDPIDGTRYEIIDGELLASKQPNLEHQFTNGAILTALHAWAEQTGLGHVYFTPGLILAMNRTSFPIWYGLVSRDWRKSANRTASSTVPRNSQSKSYRRAAPTNDATAT